MAGLVHLYCGDGKGKSTAAVGLSLRAAGAGKKVLFLQFFKDCSSSEIGLLRQIPGVEVLVCPRHFEAYGALFAEACDKAKEADLLVLDEAVSACGHGVISEEKLLAFLRDKPEELEVVLTGREPSPGLYDAADYITRMEKLRHPFDVGIPARKGIEF